MVGRKSQGTSVSLQNRKSCEKGMARMGLKEDKESSLMSTWLPHGERGRGFPQQKVGNKTKEEMKARNRFAYRKMWCLFRLQTHKISNLVGMCIMFRMALRSVMLASIIQCCQNLDNVFDLATIFLRFPPGYFPTGVCLRSLLLVYG